ncbi:MAG TPA: pyridoxamine 5'-phosphate oxidase family protein [Candidatus Binataceae bacterium]|nr:pyridoxamine 5'-phosphate oxidase family protein [Candidatus Binataceae bacterium]
MTETEFWNKAREVGAKATWAYLATTMGDQPKVRVVHPAIEGGRVWVATGRSSAKARQIGKNPRVELFYQIGLDMVHLTITGRARFVEDPLEKKRVWDGKIFDYELGQFWPQGPGSKDFGLMLIEPESAELTSLPDMTQGKSPQRWRVAR